MTAPDQPLTSNPKFSVYFYNGITYCGVFLASAVFIIELFLFSIDFFAPNHSTYLGMFTYILLPPFLILGLILIPYGAYRKRKSVEQGKSQAKVLTFFIDPSLPTHRNAIAVFTIGTIFFLVMTGIGSYKAFHFTESVHFCGKTCHIIMKPEYTLYLQSPHARVKCVECHIGPGADWYLKYKLEGARQVVAAVKNDFARPIETPIHNLRPAAETCEHCHWPGKHFSSFELRKTYFPTDESEHDRWLIRMLVKVGGDESHGAGVHAHMYNDNDIYYAAEDEKRLKITWVKSIDEHGQEIIFTTPDSAFKDSPPPPDKIRKMDCMDCHNRPSHDYRAPFELANEALLTKKIDQRIPNIKARIMSALSAKYKTEKEAVEKIPQIFDEYYRTQFAEYYKAHSAKIRSAAQQVVEMYKLNFFPEMNARWDAYPEHIGHLTSPGCFRCHDDEHKAPTGQVISRDCKICHTIIEQGPPGQTQKSAEGLEFLHPFNNDESWKDMNCFDCHTGN